MPWLEWLDRQQHVQTANTVKYRLLEPVARLGHGDPESQNLLIQGDNLDALKALQPYYAGQVKCVYADPPFNTGQALDDYDDNLEHSIWLSMIYPSMELTRDLLSEDGTLFVHIDDNELGYLIAILDEIMGRKNRVAVITFKQGAPTGHKAINPGVVNTTNFILVYAKDKSRWKPNKVYTGRERDKRYGKFLKNPDAPSEQWEFGTLTAAVVEHAGKTMRELRDEVGPVGHENYLNEFVIAHAHQVAQFVRPDYDSVSEDAQRMIDASLAEPRRIFHLAREKHSDMYFIGGQRIIFYSGKLKEVDGELVAGEPLTSLWDDLLSNNLHKEGGVEFPKSKKPEALIKRCLDLATAPGDLVMDSYLGSGTTAAVAHKMGRRWIGIERGEHAQEKVLPRLVSVVDGEQSGISGAVGWQGGGGFRFFKLGPTVFDEDGLIRQDIPYAHLAAHVWFVETGEPRRTRQKDDTPLLGVKDGTAYYLLYNGILGDRRVDGGNVLTLKLLSELPPHDGPRVIYGEATRLAADRLTSLGVVFKQIPYELKAA